MISLFLLYSYESNLSLLVTSVNPTFHAVEIWPKPLKLRFKLLLNCETYGLEKSNRQLDHLVFHSMLKSENTIIGYILPLNVCMTWGNIPKFIYDILFWYSVFTMNYVLRCLFTYSKGLQWVDAVSFLLGFSTFLSWFCSSDWIVLLWFFVSSMSLSSLN